jgi:hypothetical protein
VPATADLRIRDPFVLTDARARRYYLYGSTDPNTWDGPGTGFDAYVSDDLATWRGPHPVFRPAPGFWGTMHFWAPEVYERDGECLMLASFKAPGARRATQLLRAPGPLGPFVPDATGPLTPPAWECLDGTLYLEPSGAPWLVFCHEWLQAGDGRVCALPLRDDLRGPAGEARELFAASRAPWVRPAPGDGSGAKFVTDGPFLLRPDGGPLHLLWSSFGQRGYALGAAVSPSGRVEGPWRHGPRPLFADDGGHGMAFRDLDGRLTVALHAPNVTPLERPRFLPLRVMGESLALGAPPARAG